MSGVNNRGAGDNAREAEMRQQANNEVEMAAAAVMSNNALLTMMMMDDDDDRVEEVVVDHRIFPRSRRKKFRHDQALMCINRNYLGPERLMDDKQFEVMLRITPARFQRLFEDVGNSGIPYYVNCIDALGEEGAFMEARLMLPI
jgi:hypothetical protein